MKIFITGSSGFIGSYLLQRPTSKKDKSLYKFTIFSKMAECLKKQNKFQILKSLELDSHPTQRQLSNDLGVSLGKINYCLKSLIEKGFIKVNNFRNSNNKIQYSYLLIPKGIEEKVKNMDRDLL